MSSREVAGPAVVLVGARELEAMGGGGGGAGCCEVGCERGCDVEGAPFVSAMVGGCARSGSAVVAGVFRLVTLAVVPRWDGDGFVQVQHEICGSKRESNTRMKQHQWLSDPRLKIRVQFQVSTTLPL